MDKIRISGGVRLRGEIPISGAKNAALPLMCAALLSAEKLTLENVPRLADIRTMQKLLAQHGVAIAREEDGAMQLDGADIRQFTAPYDLVRTMRASVLVLGPLLARFGQAKVSLPGGCAIGTRPIDLHLKALEEMGAEIDIRDGYVEARVAGRLRGIEFQFEKVSVGATENILMAASLAEGESVLTNAAREPEVADLARCLVAMGAEIEGIGTHRLIIRGMRELHGARHRVIADRIETGTYLSAAAITGGEVRLRGARAQDLTAVLQKYEEAGVSIAVAEDETPGDLLVRASGGLRGVDVMTQPHPGFPTDMQAQFMALMCVAQGASMITETIFENRFMHVPELLRMGANINVQGRSAMVRGVPKLRGAEVMATDLRASVSLVLAALAAEGETVIHRVYHLDRGYERLEAKLAACGAVVERLAEEELP